MYVRTYIVNAVTASIVYQHAPPFPPPLPSPPHLFELSSSVRSNHCTACVCRALPARFMRCLAIPQHLSHRIGFRLYGIALEPAGGVGVGVGVGHCLVCTYNLAQVCLYTWHITLRGYINSLKFIHVSFF